MACCVKTDENHLNTVSEEMKGISTYIKCIIGMVKEKYNEDIDTERLYMGALNGVFRAVSEHHGVINRDSVMLEVIKGILSSVDKYSVFHHYSVAERILESLKGNRYGIGLTIARVENFIKVCEVYPFSPAADGEIVVGDKIVEINRKTISNDTIDNVYKFMQEELNARIELGIIRNGEQNILYKDVQKGKIKINSVMSFIKGDIGYIRVHTFIKNTDDSVSKVLNMIDNADIKKIILDLRYNNGGDLKQAALLAEKFVPEGLMIKVKFKSASYENIEYHSHMKNKKYKLVVLVNEETASSSEVLADVIQDTSSGILIGTITGGKAAVQKMIPILTYEAFTKAKDMAGIEVVDADELKAKWGIKPSNNEIAGTAVITIGEYITLSGRRIDKVGIAPDIYVDNSYYTKSIRLHNIQKLNSVFEYNSGDESMDIFFAKAVLKTIGYTVGEINWKLDEITINAIEKFQSDNHLNISKILDIPTQEMMNTMLETWVFKEDNQFTKAVEILNES